MANGERTAIAIKYLPQIASALKSAYSRFQAWRERRRERKAQKG